MGSEAVGTRYDHIKLNEVLWIEPEACCLPESPGGFALRVDEFLGRDHGSGEDLCRVWVRGPVLLDAAGKTPRTLTLCVPVDQPRAVLADQAPTAEPTLGAHRADEPIIVEHAGRLYRRVQIPGR
jgi:hypothetical protein